MTEVGTETYADANRLVQAIKVLEALEASGEITPNEQAALDRARAKEGEAREEVGRTRARYRGLAQGVMLNARDEISGAISAVSGGDYSEARDDVRNRDEAAQTLFPEEYSRGRMAGAGATATLPMGVGMRAAQGMGMAGRVGVGGLNGAVLGGMDGYMGGEGVPDRLMSSVPGAAVGLGIGMAAAPVAALAGAGAIGVRNRGRSVPGVHPIAGREASNALFRAEQSGTDIAQYLDSLGPEGMVADVPGAPQHLAQGLASMPGSASARLQSEVTKRAEGAGGRIRRDMDASLGGPDEAAQARRAMEAERKNEIGPMYDAARAHTSPLDAGAVVQRLDALAADSVGRVRSAINALKADIGSGPISAAKLHNIRSDFSDTLEEAARTGATKFPAQMSGVLEEIDRVLDGVPGYSTARARYADNKAAERALEDGRKAFGNSALTAMTPDELEDHIGQLGPRALANFKRGAREYISALMGTARNDAASAWGAINREWNAEKLRVILGDAAADKVIKRLRAEEQFSRTRGKVIEGSQTDFRAGAREALADLRDPNSINRPGPVARARNAVNDAANRAVDSVMYGSRRAAANDDLGRILTAQGVDRDALVTALRQLAQDRRAPSAGITAAERMLEIITGAGGVSAATTVNNN